MKNAAAEQRKNTAPLISLEEAKRRCLLSEKDLCRMGLMPLGTPVACVKREDGTRTPYFDPAKVKEAPRDYRYPKAAPQKKEPVLPLPTGEPRRVSAKSAPAKGLFSAEVLKQMYYEPTGEPVAYYIKKSGERVMLYDRATCRRLPLPCAKCGGGVRFRQKLCRDCYREELAQKRQAGDAKRLAHYGKSRDRVLFFDLEMTGVYDHDEVLSVSIVNGRGEEVFHTLTRPERKKRWKRTEKIHGITPDMVKDAPTFAEISPTLAEILTGAEQLVAFGTSTDYSHLRRVYKTREGQKLLRQKMLDLSAEFSHYVFEHELELSHLSLSDAMAHFSLEWRGTAHSSLADTDACRRVFEQLFPHYFESEA